MNDAITILLVLAALGVLLVAMAIPVSAALVRLSARRLPPALALRMEEEWSRELNSINSRPGKLAFGVALILTRRRAFVASGEETVSETATAFGGRKSLVILTTLAFAIAAYGASFLVPVRYESEALLISKEPGVLALKEMTSRALLTRVVQYLKWNENMIDDLRRNVTVTAEPLGEGPNTGSSFVVKYLGADAVSAQMATTALATRFIEQDLQYRSERSTEAQDFLKAQLTILRADLEKEGDELARQARYGPAAGVTAAVDHDLLVTSYKSMFTKYKDAQLNSGLLESTFRIVDAPQLGKAVTPNRAGFAGLGAFAGLAMGGIAVFGLDRRQRRLLASK
jgi:hypothetical protein